ncbi:hypothetical protein QLL95_gp0851 [Cotonvirus japonicus]|uniref:Uncharacterized protein n=1 Tax=Cotonvirus japonicus TaxID=2811091 RepID=A0ABM7NSY7_9VIRU|nr:hypothetical protein QLL95_gp0851 [Cotonvirus japonicus]BCS83272.1 hypothetical protein [Cotonvirus japonicus]
MSNYEMAIMGAMGAMGAMIEAQSCSRPVIHHHTTIVHGCPHCQARCHHGAWNPSGNPEYQPGYIPRPHTTGVIFSTMGNPVIEVRSNVPTVTYVGPPAWY